MFNAGRWKRIKALKMKSVDENMVIDLIKNKKLSYNEASEVLTGLYPGLHGLSSRSVRRFCDQRGISSRTSAEDLAEMVRSATSQVNLLV